LFYFFFGSECLILLSEATIILWQQVLASDINIKKKLYNFWAIYLHRVSTKKIENTKMNLLFKFFSMLYLILVFSWKLTKKTNERWVWQKAACWGVFLVSIEKSAQFIFIIHFLILVLIFVFFLFVEDRFIELIHF
jgi:hypothetical protein